MRRAVRPTARPPLPHLLPSPPLSQSSAARSASTSRTPQHRTQYNTPLRHDNDLATVEALPDVVVGLPFQVKGNPGQVERSESLPRGPLEAQLQIAPSGLEALVAPLLRDAARQTPSHGAICVGDGVLPCQLRAGVASSSMEHAGGGRRLE